MIRLALLLLLAGSGWNELAREWREALAAFEKLAPAQREQRAHPFATFSDRLRSFARRHANSPEAAPALVEIARFTPDPEERLVVLVRLRESHLRSKHLLELVPVLTRFGDAQALRTLDEIARGSPHQKIRSAAALGAYEIRKLAIGMRAPAVLGEDRGGRPRRLSDLAGKVVVVLVAAEPAPAPLQALLGLARRLKDRPLAVVTTANVAGPDGIWYRIEPDLVVLRRWNAVDSPRLFVIDRRGRLRAKDPEGVSLVAGVEDLLREPASER